MRTYMWPRRSFQRSARYVWLRITRLRATPHAIAAGVAVGVFATFTPLMGLHVLLAAALAWSIRGNVIAAALTTVLGNPITFPFIWAGTLALGRFVLNEHPHESVPFELGDALAHLDFGAVWRPLLLPMSVGGAIAGAALGAIVYVVVRWLVGTMHSRKLQAALPAQGHNP